MNQYITQNNSAYTYEIPFNLRALERNRVVCGMVWWLPLKGLHAD